jgi:CDGSH-type Zn-finger protein
MAAPKHGCEPIGVDETPGKKAYCTCGWSEKLPYCDGAHNRLDTGCSPVVVAVTDPGKKFVCQCHNTGNPPWCDGSHNRQAAP